MSELQATPSTVSNPDPSVSGMPVTERLAPNDDSPTISPDAPAATPPPQVRAIDIGTVLSRRYLIERAIGSGGMSTVFSALDRHRMHGPAADAKVAVKVLNRALLSDQARVERLIREFRYMQRLTHCGIVRVFDLDCDEGIWFITMELLQGQPLVHLLQKHPQGLPPEEALRLLTECTEALVCAHDHGVIHGDLKPGNIFVDESGAARLLDFGSVPERTDNADAARDRYLTPSYASPQMLEREPADLRDDLFSLGCVAYELFTGQHPFNAKSSTEARDEGLRLTWLPSIPARHFGVIARMLAWQRDERPTNGREFLDSLIAAQVRARAAFSREPRPATPAAEPVVSQPASPHERDDHRAAGPRRESRRAATPEELSRAFAQFAGKVPEDWVGTADAPAARASTVTDDAPANEPARDRWSRAIPPEWLEPKPKIEATTPAVDAAAPETATSPDSSAATDDEAPAAPRAVPWLSQLRWNNARVLKRVRRPVPPPIAASAETPADEPAAVADPRPAKSPPALQWRTSTSVSWAALASRLRTLRGRVGPRVVAPALNGASTVAVPGAPQARTDWTPQLQWRNEIVMRWPDLQPLATSTVIPQVQFGILSSPVVPIATKAKAATRIKVRMPSIDWRKARGAISHSAAHSRDTMRAWVGREQSRWRKELRSLPHWLELRTAIGSLTTSRGPRERRSWSGWLTQRAPRWREAIPAVAIAGIGFFAWGLLQVSDASRSTASLSAERSRLTSLRLQQLADAPIEMTMPLMADLPPPIIPAEPRQAARPPAPGTISFQSSRIRVSAGQQMAVVNLRRNKSTHGAAPFGWRIAPGTARPGVDYEQPKIQVARFNDGQDVRSLYIPIAPSRDGERPERRFTIELMQTPGGPAFGEITETEIVIEGSG